MLMPSIHRLTWIDMLILLHNESIYCVLWPIKQEGTKTNSFINALVIKYLLNYDDVRMMHHVFYIISI